MAEEPDTYDLAFDPDDEPTPTPPTAKPIAKPDKPAASADLDPIELDDVEPQISDPRAGGTPSRPKPPINPTPEVEDDQPAEPVAVSPAKAQAKREEQRRRAAQELAEADARKKKIILIVVGSFVAVGIVGFIALKLFG
ncbi:MAG: hypothetical protein AAF086_05180 [Planctomycetota bacterium]